MPFKAKNNREAVVVCAIHVVKRPSKRSVLVYIKMILVILYIKRLGFVWFVCPELIEELVRPTDFKFGRGMGIPYIETSSNI